MADLTKTVTLARADAGAVVRPYQAAASGSLLDAVTVDTNGKVAKSVNASGKCIGLVVSSHRKNTSGTYAANEQVGVCVWGPVEGFSGLTKGKLVYLAATSGVLADTGSVPIGYAESDTCVFVMPGIANAAS